MENKVFRCKPYLKLPDIDAHNMDEAKDTAFEMLINGIRQGELRMECYEKRS